MNDKREENFKQALKTLVLDEPEKLAFFDGSGAQDEIPPFAPAQAAPERRKYISRDAKRRRYSYGMAAAAACVAFFLCVAAVNSGPSLPSGLFDGPDGGSAGGGAAAQAQGDGDEAAPQSDDAGEATPYHGDGAALPQTGEAATPDPAEGAVYDSGKNDSYAPAELPVPPLDTAELAAAPASAGDGADQEEAAQGSVKDGEGIGGETGATIDGEGQGIAKNGEYIGDDADADAAVRAADAGGGPDGQGMGGPDGQGMGRPDKQSTGGPAPALALIAAFACAGAFAFLAIKRKRLRQER